MLMMLPMLWAYITEGRARPTPSMKRTLILNKISVLFMERVGLVMVTLMLTSEHFTLSKCYTHMNSLLCTAKDWYPNVREEGKPRQQN